MKRVMAKTFYVILIAFLMSVAGNAMSVDVFKVVDEDGNVTYTDKPPADGSGPIKLAPISVIETPVYEYPVKADSGGEGGTGEDNGEMSLRDLRKQYSDFAIVSPQPEESVWHPDTPVTVAWTTGYALQQGMQVTIYVDGKQHSITTAQTIAVDQMERGEHKIEAQLTDSRNRKIATAKPVTFFVRRPGVANNIRRARGG